MDLGVQTKCSRKSSQEDKTLGRERGEGPRSFQATGRAELAGGSKRAVCTKGCGQGGHRRLFLGCGGGDVMGKSPSKSSGGESPWRRGGFRDRCLGEKVVLF